MHCFYVVMILSSVFPVLPKDRIGRVASEIPHTCTTRKFDYARLFV